MRLKIIDIREDYKGDLWFLCENYYTSSQDSEINENWWLHLSDEYAEMRVQDGPVNGKQYRLIEVKSDDERLQEKVQEVPEVAGHQGAAADRTN